MRKYKAVKFLKFVVIFIVAAFVFSYIVMRLWNWLIPDIFNGEAISILQAFGLLVLSKILFTGFRGRPCCCRSKRGTYWREHLQRKLEKMTPEEREKFKAKFKNRCHGDFNFEQATASSNPDEK